MCFRSASHSYTCIMAWQSEDKTILVGDLLGKCSASYVVWAVFYQSLKLVLVSLMTCSVLGIFFLKSICVSVSTPSAVEAATEMERLIMGQFVSSAVFELGERFRAYFFDYPYWEFVQRRSLLHCIIPYEHTLQTYVLSVSWCQHCGGEVYYMHYRSSVCHSNIYDSFLTHLTILEAISVANIATISLPVRSIHSLRQVKVWATVADLWIWQWAEWHIRYVSGGYLYTTLVLIGCRYQVSMRPA